MTVALFSTRDDHEFTFRSEIVAFDPVVDCVDVILQREECLSHHLYRWEIVRDPKQKPVARLT